MCSKQQIIRTSVFVFQVKFMRCILANTVYKYMRISTYQISETNPSCSMDRKKFMCVHMLYSWSDFPHLLFPSTFSSHYLLFVHLILHHTALHHVCHLKWVFTSYSTSIIFPKHVETCNIPRSVTLTSFFWNNPHTKKDKYTLSQVWVVRTQLQNVCMKMRPEGKTRALNNLK